MMRIKENYYIKKYYGDFVLLKRAKNKENCKKVLEKVGVYGTLREVKEAIIKEMIKDEVNHRKTEPLYKLPRETYTFPGAVPTAPSAMHALSTPPQATGVPTAKPHCKEASAVTLPMI